MNAPLAVVFGLVDVSVAQSESGAFLAVMSSPKTNGPVPLTGLGLYERAVDNARAYAAQKPGCILRLPDGLGEYEGRGLVHVQHSGDGLEVFQMSRGEGSGACLRGFAKTDAKRAIRFALDSCREYDSRLGSIAT